MTIDEILAAFARCSGDLPHAAIAEAVARREEITPALLDILDAAQADIQHLIDDQEDTAYIFALYLLSQFREPRAYRRIVGLFSLPEDTLDAAFGDLTTEALNRFLASTFDGDVAPLHAMTERRDISMYARSAALQALSNLTLHGVLPRDEVVAYIDYLLREGIERDNATMLGFVVGNAVEMASEALMPVIRQLYADNLVDTGYIGLDFVESALARGQEAEMAYQREDPHNHFITDTDTELCRWYCFNPEMRVDQARLEALHQREAELLQRKAELEAQLAQEQLYAHTHAQRKQAVRVAPTPGRNAPCPCGSGKKYKRCCGA